MTTIALEEVSRLRARIAEAQAMAGARFRDAFANAPLDPLAHLELQAAALLECAEGVRARGAVHYDVANGVTTPYVVRGEPLYRFFDIDRRPEAVLEYWLIVSEIVGSSAWRVTRLIATPDDYDAALRRMQSPQLVRALVVSHLPDCDLRDDGSALLDVTVYSRAGEERIERRSLLLDPQNEFHYHGRELLAEGRGGVNVD